MDQQRRGTSSMTTRALLAAGALLDGGRVDRVRSPMAPAVPARVPLPDSADEAVLGVRQLCELAGVNGVAVVGLLPGGAQLITPFSGADNACSRSEPSAHETSR